MGNKSTYPEIDIRIDTICEMLIKSVSRKKIVRFCSEKYGITSRQTDTYIKKAREQIKNEFPKEKKSHLIRLSLAQYEDLYAKSYTIEDYRECRSIIESRNKLLGLYENEKIDHNFAQTGVIILPSNGREQ